MHKQVRFLQSKAFQTVTDLMLFVMYLSLNPAFIFLANPDNYPTYGEYVKNTSSFLFLHQYAYFLAASMLIFAVLLFLDRDKINDIVKDPDVYYTFRFFVTVLIFLNWLSCVGYIAYELYGVETSKIWLLGQVNTLVTSTIILLIFVKSYDLLVGVKTFREGLLTLLSFVIIFLAIILLGFSRQMEWILLTASVYFVPTILYMQKWRISLF